MVLLTIFICFCFHGSGKKLDSLALPLWSLGYIFFCCHYIPYEGVFVSPKGVLVICHLQEVLNLGLIAVEVVSYSKLIEQPFVTASSFYFRLEVTDQD